ncbi:MAG: hypothetical protein RBR34_09640 [Rhodospirillaceae bacterium]|nr:hypothetical protein [Rhodospirillaceae bacterium]
MDEKEGNPHEDEESPAPAPLPMPRKSRFHDSWIARHWRGDLSLGISFWVNGALVGLVLSFLAYLITPLAEKGDPSVALAYLAAFYLVFIIVQLWRIIGIWRSAQKHVSRGGQPGWAIAAKIIVIINLLQIFGTTQSTIIPVLRESYDIVRGDPGIGKHTIRQLNSTEIEFSGGIPFGAAKDLRGFLDANPGVRVIHLSSHGGRNKEAEVMRDLIRERKLTTVVTADCLSACTIVFLGGAQRYIHPQLGRLGFHRPSTPGAAEWADAIAETTISDAMKAGVSYEFIKKAYTTPNDSMWFPTTDEILASHYATGVTRGQFALSWLGKNTTREEAEDMLRKIPYFAAIEKAEPKAFDRIAKMLTAAALLGLSESAAFNAIASEAQETTLRSLPYASDEAVIAFGRFFLAQMTTLSAKDPVLCHKYLFKKGKGMKEDEIKETTNLAREGEIKIYTEVLNSRGAEPKQALTEDRIKAVNLIIFDKILKKNGSDTLNKFINFPTGLPENETCPLLVLYYDAALSLPEPLAVAWIRHQMGSSRP